MRSACGNVRVCSGRPARDGLGWNSLVAGELYGVRGSAGRDGLGRRQLWRRCVRSRLCIGSGAQCVLMVVLGNLSSNCRGSGDGGGKNERVCHRARPAIPPIMAMPAVTLTAVVQRRLRACRAGRTAQYSGR